MYEVDVKTVNRVKGIVLLWRMRQPALGALVTLHDDAIAYGYRLVAAAHCTTLVRTRCKLYARAGATDAEACVIRDLLHALGDTLPFDLSNRTKPQEQLRSHNVLACPALTKAPKLIIAILMVGCTCITHAMHMHSLCIRGGDRVVLMLPGNVTHHVCNICCANTAPNHAPQSGATFALVDSISYYTHPSVSTRSYLHSAARLGNNDPGFSTHPTPGDTPGLRNLFIHLCRRRSR